MVCVLARYDVSDFKIHCSRLIIPILLVIKKFAHSLMLSLWQAFAIIVAEMICSIRFSFIVYF